MAVVRRVITFDVPGGPIGPYDAADGLARLRRLPGVQSVGLYEAVSGHPEYMLDIQLDQTAGDQIDRELDQQFQEQAQYLANVVRRQFRPLA